MIVGKPINLDTASGIQSAAPVEEKDVNLIDYDGTLLYSYTAKEFLTLTSWPKNPVRTGLSAQGWNWSLSEAQSYVSNCGGLTVGQVYNTSDGKTRVHIHLSKGRTDPYLGLAVDGEVEVDWGDGSNPETVSGTSISDSGVADVISTPHSYAAPGDYVIAIHVLNGQFSIKGTSSYTTLLWKNETTNTGENSCYRDSVVEIHVGNGCVFGPMACCAMRGLTVVSFPNGFNLNSCSSVFSKCFSLRCAVLPNYCDVPLAAFSLCYSLFRVSLPENGAVGNEAFDSCRALTWVSLPANLTALGQKTFQYCNCLYSVTLPASLTSLGNLSLAYTDIRELKLPNGLTQIGSESIRAGMSMSRITIPASVTSIGSMALSYCYGLKKITFKGKTPPTVQNSNAWNNIPTDCVIVVPVGKLSTYKNAANYPSSSTYTYMTES